MKTVNPYRLEEMKAFKQANNYEPNLHTPKTTPTVQAVTSGVQTGS